MVSFVVAVASAAFAWAQWRSAARANVIAEEALAKYVPGWRLTRYTSPKFPVPFLVLTNDSPETALDVVVDVQEAQVLSGTLTAQSVTPGSSIIVCARFPHDLDANEFLRIEWSRPVHRGSMERMTWQCPWPIAFGEAQRDPNQ